jgi:hypothetical protein
MLTSTSIPVNGMLSSFPDDSVLRSAAPFEIGACPQVEPAHNAFGRIVSLFRSNAFLFSELQNVKLKLARARVYRDTPGSNPVLAEAHVLQLRAKHSAVLTMLRANRIEARRLLGHPVRTLASASA